MWPAAPGGAGGVLGLGAAPSAAAMRSALTASPARWPDGHRAGFSWLPGALPPARAAGQARAGGAARAGDGVWGAPAVVPPPAALPLLLALQRAGPAPMRAGWGSAALASI